MVRRPERIAGTLGPCQRLRRYTVDRVGERNQETALRMRASDSRQCSGCHDRSNLTAANRDKPMYEGADLAGLKNIQSSALTWDDIRRLRDLTKMKMVIKGILAWEDAKIAADAGIDTIIVSNHGGRSGTLHHRVFARDQTGIRQHAGAD